MNKMTEIINKISIRYIMRIVNCKIVKEKKYTETEATSEYVYLFNNRQEYYNYFLENNVDLESCNKEIIETPIFFEFENENIIAFKGMCDFIITETRKLQKKEIELQKREIKLENEIAELRNEFKTLTRKLQTYPSSIK